MENTKNMQTFNGFISSRLKILNFQFVLVFSLAFVLLSVFPVLYLKEKSELISIRSISTYLENLIATNDRIEIQKVLRSIALTRESEIELVKDGKIFSVTNGNERLDQDFKEQAGFKFNGIYFSKSSYFLTYPLKNNSYIYIFCDYSSLFKVVFSLLFLVLIAVGGFLFVYYKKVNNVILKSLSPLTDLEKDISGLLDGKVLETKNQEIIELESIRQTLVKTNNELENAKEVLASEKAKKLNAEAYKKLIHDLHNPVASLQNTVSAVNDPFMDLETKKEVINMIPDIASQLLSQVVAAKKNLEFDSVNLQNRDVKECLHQCVTLIKGNNKKEKEIIINIADEKLIIPHDPILLQRAILNLMENGLEFSKDKVELKALKHNDYVSIVVSDDGVGMKREDVPVFFQGRGKSSRADRQAFGLSSANHIVRLHGGKLIYAKNENGGASFELRLNL